VIIEDRLIGWNITEEEEKHVGLVNKQLFAPQIPAANLFGLYFR